MSLQGKTVLITRRREQSEDFINAIEQHNGRAVVISMIEIADPKSWAECDLALEALPQFDAVVFSSTNSVTKFFGRIESTGVNVPRLKMYAVGEKTREALERHGVSVDFVPEEFSARSLAKLFKTQTVSGKKFLLTKGNLGRRELAEALEDLGADVTSIIVYETVPPDDRTKAELNQRLYSGEFDVVTFASPSAVKNFADAVVATKFVGFGSRPLVAAIGPTTKEAANKLGFRVDIEAATSTANGLVEAISEFYKIEQP